MSRQPHATETRPMKRVHHIHIMGLLMAMTLHAAETVPQAMPPADDGAIPRAVNMEAFEALVTNSPFTRSLGVSDSLILTGVAHFENDTFATLLDTKTFESHVVSKNPNFQGWQLVDVGGHSAEIQTWSAKIQIPGGEVISVRYQKPPPKPAQIKSAGSSSGGNSSPLTSTQLNEAKTAALNYKEGFSSDGYPKAPPPEMVAKLSRLSTSQRETINQQMLGLRNQGLGLNDRRKIYEGLVDRSLQRR
ncbi:hypothetical protein [Prosthecobacter sp.]|uniref:hypothetical protein n=1 Tax=Prosthecobacter sp. TaxID=1965333 RepID=UPI00248884D5|nr:hypothetical protein [Prosthecobacter sp.]MDI1313119.1 hypothetical protein [Prosthecobacter sp.]